MKINIVYTVMIACAMLLLGSQGHKMLGFSFSDITDGVSAVKDLPSQIKEAQALMQELQVLKADITNFWSKVKAEFTNLEAQAQSMLSGLVDAAENAAALGVGDIVGAIGSAFN